MSDATRIAVVDDEEDLRSAVAAYLRLHGFDAVECADGRALDRAMQGAAIGLVVLDVNMHGEDGFAIARRLRAGGDIGIVMLTARTDLIDRVVGLELGADDYVAKPFELRELVARIRAVLRRTEKARSAPAKAPRPNYFDALWVQDRGPLVRIAVADVEWIEAARDYALLHTPSRVHSLRVTMDELEKQLDPSAMLRVHRSAFVKPSTMTRFRLVGRGGRIELDNGRMMAVGPSYVAAVSEALRPR